MICREWLALYQSLNIDPDFISDNSGVDDETFAQSIKQTKVFNNLQNMIHVLDERGLLQKRPWGHGPDHFPSGSMFQMITFPINEYVFKYDVLMF